MKFMSSILLTCFTFLFGICFYAYQQEWIIFLFPHQTIDFKDEDIQVETTFTQKKISLFFWKHERWHKEQNHVIWSSETTHNIQAITHNWLTLAEDEKLIDTDIQLLSAVLTTNKELFLSFNKNLCNNQDSTFTKLMLIHGLLKTFHENQLPLQSVRFLVHHRIMTDDHLNFTVSWPIIGYIPLA